MGNYLEYDLSKMVNSKGGFLIEEEGEDEDLLKTKERERERQRAMQSLDPRQYILRLFSYSQTNVPVLSRILGQVLESKV